MGVFIKHNGSWKNSKQVYIKENGEWYPMFSSAPASDNWIYAISDWDYTIKLNGNTMSMETSNATSEDGYSLIWGDDGYLYAGNYTEVNKINSTDLTSRIIDTFTDPSSSIKCLTWINGYVYVGGFNNVRKVDPYTMSQVGIYDLSENDATALAYDKDGYIWIGTSYNKSIQKINPSDMTLAAETTAINANVTSLALGTDGYMYVGMSDYIQKIDSGTMEIIDQYQFGISADVHIVWGTDNYLYAGLSNSELFKIDPSNMSLVSNTTHSNIHSICWGIADNLLYLGCYNDIIKVNPSDLSEDSRYSDSNLGEVAGITSAAVPGWTSIISYLWTWGNNTDGRLGLGNTTSKDTPTQVNTNTDWRKIAAGETHSMALKIPGSLWAWGDNYEGKLGLGDTDNRDVPTQVGTDTDWKLIDTPAGGAFTLAIKFDGTLWAWGDNWYGQLGLGDNTDKNTPTQVGTDTDWIYIATGYYHSMAIKTDGTLWTWGDNNYGKLGLGDTNDRNTPTQVGTDTNWATADGGEGHTLAIRTDGTLWGAGENYKGELGTGGSPTSIETITQIGSDTDWAKVSLGRWRSHAIKSDGTLWSCGDNDYGQLGTLITTDKNTFTQVGIDADWTKISAGKFHTLAIKTNNTLWAWGYNTYGQLGLGDDTDRDTPAKVSNGWKEVSGGWEHTMGILSSTLSKQSAIFAGSDWETIYKISTSPMTLLNQIGEYTDSTEVGNPQIFGFDYDTNGYLYAVGSDYDSGDDALLLKLDPDSLSVVYKVNLGSNNTQSYCAYNPNDGYLYVAEGWRPGSATGDIGRIHKVDPSNGNIVDKLEGGFVRESDGYVYDTVCIAYIYIGTDGYIYGVTNKDEFMLIKVDPDNMTIVNKLSDKDFDNLSGGYFNHISLDKDNNIYTGRLYYNGEYCHSLKISSNFTILDSLGPNEGIEVNISYSSVMGPDGYFYIGTDEQEVGVIKINPSDMSVVNTYDVQYMQFHSMVFDDEGFLYALEYGEVHKIDTSDMSQVEVFTPDNNNLNNWGDLIFDSNRYKTLLLTGSERIGPYLYVGTGQGNSTEIHQLDVSSMSLVNSNAAYSDTILDIYASSSYIYTANSYGVISKIEYSDMSIIDSFNGNIGDAAYRVRYGNNGYLYASYNSGSILKINSNDMSQVASYSTSEITRALCFGNDNYLYAGDNGGNIYKIDPADMSLSLSVDVASGGINFIAYGSDGYLYVSNSEYPGTVDKIDPSNLSVIDEYTGFSDYVWDLIYDIDGYIYACGYQNDGVHKIDTSNMSQSATYTGFGTSSFSSTLSITMDYSGFIYAGGDAEEVHKIDKATMNFDSSYTNTTGTIEALYFI